MIIVIYYAEVCPFTRMKLLTEDSDEMSVNKKCLYSAILDYSA